jgi:hypothetical protein
MFFKGVCYELHQELVPTSVRQEEKEEAGLVDLPDVLISTPDVIACR